MPFAHYPNVPRPVDAMRSPREGAGVRFPARLDANASKRRSARPPFATSCSSRLVEIDLDPALLSRAPGV